MFLYDSGENTMFMFEPVTTHCALSSLMFFFQIVVSVVPSEAAVYTLSPIVYVLAAVNVVCCAGSNICCLCHTNESGSCLCTFIFTW